VSDGEGRGVGESDGEGEAIADSVALGVALGVAPGVALDVALAWALPPGFTTTSRHAATIATTAITLTAITTDLWPVQMRSMTGPNPHQ
jgi:hypothetical protein